MSGIVGIVNLDGSPVDRELLDRMTERLAFRGPDGQRTWADGAVGFGHTMLRTETESLGEEQPWSLDGQVWITADARVDGRDDLIQKLRPKVRGELEDVTDVDLILHAYQVWGEDCIQHLLGDFAFAIWDSRKKRLFCGRDHFGVKPFYYAHLRNCMVFSNTLNCIRKHPAVSDELNDRAIADFLLFDQNMDRATTSFADIQCLPPAHCLTCSEGTLRLKRYWTLPTDGHIRYKRAGDYVERFRELLRTAVGDRLRADRVGIFMSGGLDSTAVAATACELRSSRFPQMELRAHTIVFDRLIPDQERKYSGLAAQALGIPIQYMVADDYLPYELWDTAEFQTPEPRHNPVGLAISLDLTSQVAGRSRVVLTGYGGDPALYYGCQSYVLGLLKGMQFGRLVGELGGFILSRRRIPLLGIRTALKRWLGKQPWRPPYPGWINGNLADRLDLPARWEQVTRPPSAPHPIRPKAYEILDSLSWQRLFETEDPGVTLAPVEGRHPFFDVRLVNYLLAIPPLPWFENKELVRRSMRGVLPDRIRLRPKAPLAGDPCLEHFRNSYLRWRMGHFDPAPELSQFVDYAGKELAHAGGEGSTELWVNLRPLSLNYWLRRFTAGRYNCIKGEEVYGTAR